ncbi:MAG: THUMP-like domain-containing protein [Caldilineaceae bacterium]
MTDALLDDVTQATADFLLSREAQRACAGLTSNDLSADRTLATLLRLRGEFSGEEAGAILTLARLRLRAASKFPDAERMYFTPEALEQATAWPVALHRAEWIHRNAPSGSVLDLGCGIGGDTLALATYRRVIAFEKDPVRVQFASANARATGREDRIEFRNADWTSELAASKLPMASAAFVDPSRRIDGRRVFSLQETVPPLSELLRLREQIPNLAVKVMPSVKDAEIPAGCGVEFVSHAGVCKEAVLWFGAFADHTRWASVHAGGGWHKLVAGEDRPPLGALQPGFFLYEPDPAVIRAGAFSELCALLDAGLVDPHIAYLVSPARVGTPFAAAFHILEVHPYNLRRLNARLRQLGISEVELKKRGAPFEPESLRPRLKLPAFGSAGVVFFTRIGSTPTMIIAQRA